MDLAALEMAAHAPVVLYLQSPKEKIWGLLLSVSTAGIVLRGIDLVIFDDWMLGLSTFFYPMHRVERMERDETIGPIVSYADRFTREAGRTVLEAMGVVPGKD